MAVPFTFGNAAAAIPLSELDANFATPITLGSTSIQLGDSVPTIDGLTLSNVTIYSSTLPVNVANGGTGLSSPGLSGNVLTSTGTAWISQAIGGGSGSIAANGYQTLFNGLILQWGNSATVSGGTPTTVTFPIAFPNACFVVLGTASAVPPTYPTGDNTCNVTDVTASSFGMTIAGQGGGLFFIDMPFFWFAVGH